MNTEGVKIYRVEDKYHRGPYQPGISLKWMDKTPYHCKETFMAEFGTEFLHDRQPGEMFFCGFTSLDQLRSWFSLSELKKLKKLGFHVVKLTAHRIIHTSENQTVFSRIMK